MESKLNTNIPKVISDFEVAIKEFELRKKIYQIVFRGKGLDFESYRAYSPDDDASSIDWKASKRANSLLVRRYIEERDLEIVFVIDVGNKMISGSSNKLKCEYTAELVSALAHLIITSGDKLGFILYSDGIKKFYSPKKGIQQFYNLVNELTKVETYEGVSDISLALDFVLDSLDDSVFSVIFISDFLDVKKHLSEKFFLIANRFETISIIVKDPLDLALPNVNKEFLVQDSRTGQKILINPKVVKNIYRAYAMKQDSQVKEIFKDSDIDFLDVVTNKEFIFPLADFLVQRATKRGF